MTGTENLLRTRYMVYSLQMSPVLKEGLSVIALYDLHKVSSIVCVALLLTTAWGFYSEAASVRRLIAGILKVPSKVYCSIIKRKTQRQA